MKDVFFKKFKILISLIFVVTLNIGISFAQSVEVTGVVTDTNNEPLIGATVMVKGTTTGTITDFDGKFVLFVKTQMLYLNSPI